MSVFPKVLVLATSRHSHGGISSVVMAHEQTEEWRKHGCKWVATHRSGSKLTKLAYFFGGMARYLCLLPWCDSVHAHIGEAPSAIRKRLFLKLAKLAGKKTIVHLHAFDMESTVDGAYGHVYKKLFEDADRVVVLSEFWKKKVNERLQMGDKAVVLYNPCPKTDEMPALAIAKEKWIISAGVVNSRKGYQDLIRAFAKIATSHPDWKVVFAGSGEIENGKALAEELGIERQVEFAGWISGDDKNRLFRKASILCLPSYAEGFPMAVLDAWAYGLPVVATPVGSLPDFVHDGEDILLFNPGDTAKLASQLDRMIGDDALREQISAASRAFARNKFNLRTIGAELGKIYDNLALPSKEVQKSQITH